MKLFVTGGAGFIGSNFIRHVLNSSENHSITNCDKLTYAGNLANLDSVRTQANYRFLKGDICDPTALEAAMTGSDTVIHFAAESHVDRSIYEPAVALETNVKGTFTLLQIARKLKIPRFVHISTDEVYGDVSDGESAEGDPLRPRSPYSASKISLIFLALIGQPTSSGTMCVAPGIAGRPAAANLALSIAADSCCARRSSFDTLR